MEKNLEHHPGFLVYDITRLLRQVFGARLQDLALSESRWRLLATLSRYQGIGQTQLATHLAIGRAPLGELVDKLQVEGLVERRENPADGRAKQLFTTDKANPLITEIQRRFQAFKLELLRNLPESKQQALEATLRRVYTNLISLAPEAPPELPTGEQSLMHIISCIGRLNRRHFDTELKALGFTRAQWLVLAGIRKNEGVQQNVLAQTLSMRKAPLGVLIDNLEANGWVERKPHPQDRRANQLFLSVASKGQMATLSASFDELHHSTLKNISIADKQSLVSSLALIRGNLLALAS
ncbi:MAG: MarR family transcriptional regulator [Halioglobus sp.]